ncbi:unnamed protein product [Calypogeia fissa]
MDDYHEYKKAHLVEIEAWKQHWSPQYVSMISCKTTSTQTTPSTPSTSSSGTSSTSGLGASSSGVLTRGTGPLPTFDPVVEFF